MDLSQVKFVKANFIDFQLPYPINDILDFEGYIVINNKCAIPIENISSYIDKSDQIICDIHGNDIGVICLLAEKELDINALTEYQFCALFIDSDNYIEIKNNLFQFKKNYAVIDEPYLINYLLDYKDSAPIWGLFNHKSSIVVSPPIINNPGRIKALKLNNFNNDYYLECSIRGIQQSYAFERFLKYYHLLELGFDYEIVKKIQALNEKSSKEIAKLIIQYEDKDVNRLKYLFDTYCLDVASIVIELNKIITFESLAIEIFYDFGKDSNPIPELSHFKLILTKPDLFSFQNYKSILNSKATIDTYNTFIRRLAIYWIYRVRCCIAHNKIGEYVLNIKDEQFITDFAFPLLHSIIIQCFK